MALLGEGSFLSDSVAFLTALGGVLIATLSLLRYLDERRKRKAGEKKLSELRGQVAALRRDLLIAQEPDNRPCPTQEDSTLMTKRLQEILAILRDSDPRERQADG
jgi:hypothetical protein